MLTRELCWYQCHSGTVKLDKDDVNGHGPETLTIEHFNPGQYVLRVDDYRYKEKAVCYGGVDVLLVAMLAWRRWYCTDVHSSAAVHFFCCTGCCCRVLY